MRAQDKPIFARAATKFNAWILVRRTNPDSLKYVGRTGFVPKPLDCKPKTADLDTNGKTLAGLVADPTLHPTAFRAGKLDVALRIWKKFVTAHRLDNDRQTAGRYAIDLDRASRHYGCLKLEGAYLHGDYDLYDIILADFPRVNLAAVETMHGAPHRRGVRFYPIQEFINAHIGSAMIQHGGEAQFADHSEQAIDVFGPQGEQFTLLNKYSVSGWYERIARKTLGNS